MAPPAGRNLRLWAELVVLFVAAPVIMAAGLPGSFMWPALATIAVVGIVLLSITPGFRWRDLVSRQALRIDWVVVAVYVVVAVAVCYALTVWLVPERLFGFPQGKTKMWLVVMVAYPLVSAIPQELVFRVLFFERYGHLFPNIGVAIAVNAGLFGLAHLFYWNWPAVVLTTAAGAVFAWAYASRQSFGMACLLHALGGQIVFTVGMGVYFFHGAIGRV